MEIVFKMEQDTLYCLLQNDNLNIYKYNEDDFLEDIRNGKFEHSENETYMIIYNGSISPCIINTMNFIDIMFKIINKKIKSVQN